MRTKEKGINLRSQILLTVTPHMSSIGWNVRAIVFMWDKRRFRDRVAEHRYAIRTGNMNYPMVKHFIQAKHGSDSNLKVIGIEHLSVNIRGGDRLRRLKQYEMNWIHKLIALSYSGLTEDIDFSPFL